MNNDIKFWNKMAPKYSRKPVPDQKIYEKKLALTQEYLKPHMEVLEIGCGTGTTALFHAPFVKSIKAIDFSENMIAIAQEKAEKQSIENVDFDSCDISDMKFSEQSFDVIMAHSILHLMESHQAAIKSAFELLRPGGVFISSTACIDDFFKLFKYIWPAAVWLGIFPFVKSFKRKELITIHKEIGFTIDYEWCPDKQSVFLIARKPE